MGTVSSLLEKWVLQRQQEWGGGRKQIPLCMGIWQRDGFEITGGVRRLRMEEDE